MPDSFPKSHRLLSKPEFDRVFARRASAADGNLVVYCEQNELTHPRLGLVVSRKVGNAVVRNRWKRLLREAFRLHQHELRACDFICLPRGHEPPTFDSIVKSLTVLAKRAAKRLGD